MIASLIFLGWLAGAVLVGFYWIRLIGKDYAIWNNEVIEPLLELQRQQRASEAKGEYVYSYNRPHWPGLADSAAGARTGWVATRLMCAAPVVIFWPIAFVALKVFQSGVQQGETLAQAKARADAAEAENARIIKEEGWDKL